MWESFWTWAGARKVIAGIFAALSVLALVSAIDSCQQRRAAEGYLQAGREQTARLQGLLDNSAAQYRDRIRDLEARVAAADRLEAAARKRLDEARAAAGRPFVPPAGKKETIDRFRALGYNAGDK